MKKKNNQIDRGIAVLGIILAVCCGMVFFDSLAHQAIANSQNTNRSTSNSNSTRIEYYLLFFGFLVFFIGIIKNQQKNKHRQKHNYRHRDDSGGSINMDLGGFDHSYDSSFDSGSCDSGGSDSGGGGDGGGGDGGGGC
jgi:uncharacterized membrane protein YgcG